MTSSKKDWAGEIIEKIESEYECPYTLADEMLRDTISEVLKSVSEEMTSRIRECKQRLPKLRGNAWLKENGEIRAFEYVLEYLDRIFREKMEGKQ